MASSNKNTRLNLGQIQDYLDKHILPYAENHSICEVTADVEINGLDIEVEIKRNDDEDVENGYFILHLDENETVSEAKLERFCDEINDKMEDESYEEVGMTAYDMRKEWGTY